jgi:hypothetical protein
VIDEVNSFLTFIPHIHSSHSFLTTAVIAKSQDERVEVQKAQNHVIFLLNFFDELRRRVPVERK